MHCPSCSKEVVADKLFCNWCDAFMPNKTVGKKADLFRRGLASAIDPFIVMILYLILGSILGAIFGRGIKGFAFVIVTTGYVYFLSQLLSKGMTLGKWLLGVKVVEKLTGNSPGFWRMILRETIGKFVSGLVFSLGYFWAIWDKDGQAWHDKIAGTVVVKEQKQ
ncbi:conserved hypothetical protein [Candidatus Brocadia pituitae]|nr:conserved hypothetical protein [Candidatus Brocadia pituitae]